MSAAAPPALAVSGLRKSFTLHAQETTFNVLDAIGFEVARGECVALDAPSGRGKSTLLRALYGNYRADAGSIVVRHRGEPVDLATAPPRLILEIRRETLGYVSQFLRVVPRVPVLDVVAEPLLQRGIVLDAARARAAALLSRLAVPERLWPLPPATFSGGEQQRVNIARGLIAEHPILLLDEPTASLDPANRRRVVEVLADCLHAGTAVIGVFHDAEIKAALSARLFSLGAGSAAL